jgi:hypothetical protein
LSDVAVWEEWCSLPNGGPMKAIQELLNIRNDSGQMGGSNLKGRFCRVLGVKKFNNKIR